VPLLVACTSVPAGAVLSIRAAEMTDEAVVLPAWSRTTARRS
jgi:hypothetical protein